MGQIIEYIAIMLIVLGLLAGLLKGFVKIFFSWFSICIGVIVSINFSYGFARGFFPQYSNNIILVFFIGIFLFSLVYIFIAQLSKGISAVLHHSNLSALDHLLGGVFGAVQMMLVVGLAIYWLIIWQGIDLSAYPVSMFSTYWAEKIITIVGSKVDIANKLL